MVVAD